MADNSIQQALLEDAPNMPKRKSSEGTKRFRRCRSTPSTDPDKSSMEGGSSRQAKELFKEFRPSFKLVGLLLFVYLLVGVIIFYLVMDQISGKRTNRVLDAFYFTIVTMTSVGYGDLSPNSNATKLLACAFVFVGMAIIALFISRAADYLVEKQEMLFFKALHMNMQGAEAKMLKAMEANRIKYKFYTAAFFILYLAELYTERRQKILTNWVLTRRITTMDLEAADLDGDRQVGAAEFVIYKLKELGKISQEEISSFLEEFDKLDVDQSGTLSAYDLILAQPAQ
ncbi:hypothetical protein QOZ80_3AG0215730 [Eleusine coracana subsp. coracana]|nr:hypothetical protein QOZ80_3AG0215730 [Eleusine coracana subsp. coracana]